MKLSASSYGILSLIRYKVMYHRYGRHGPHAWRTRTQRRFENHPTAVHVVHVAIIYVNLPVIHAERIIVVMNTLNTPEKSTFVEIPPSEALAVDLTTSINARQSDSDHSDPLLSLQREAKAEGARRAISDIRRFNNNEIAAISSDRLPEYAQDNVIDYIQKNIPAAFDNAQVVQRLTEEYIKAYLVGYQDWLNVAGKSGLISDEITISIQEKARKDKIADGDALSATEIEYQAVIRAYERLHPDTRPGSGYLQKIVEYVHIYTLAYDQYNPVKEREVERTQSGSSARFQQYR